LLRERHFWVTGKGAGAADPLAPQPPGQGISRPLWESDTGRRDLPRSFNFKADRSNGPGIVGRISRIRLSDSDRYPARVSRRFLGPGNANSVLSANVWRVLRLRAQKAVKEAGDCNLPEMHDGLGREMKRSLFSRSKSPAGPRGRRAYAIGDIHGCLDLLERLLSRIEAQIESNPKPKTSIVFLGDVIDRGPESAQVIERLRNYSNPNATAHFIMGNHEEIMLRVMDGESALLANWLRFGGSETLRSYGIDPRELAKRPKEEVAGVLQGAIPVNHRRFLASFADSISFGDYVFVHAGIRPGVDLAEQSQADLRWIRDPFLDDPTDHGYVVVHGHTISNEVDVAPNRIGIDTGAYSTGVLTALAIEGPRRWFVQTSEDETLSI
jgi:serine/threonine protein phosphatase 1